MAEELIKSIVTGVLINNSKGKYLLVKKSDKVGPYPGTYLTPGGGVNTGELVDNAALRELYEETGVEVKNLKRVFFDEDVTENWQGVKRHYIMLMYPAEYVSGALRQTEGNDDKFEDVNWFSIDDLRKMNLSPPLVKLLKNQRIL
jgi:8-oxo-dGTP diphosphatase